MLDLSLVEFVERQILPRYSHFDRAHDLRHANGVIARSLALARKVGADVNMAYAVAAYHDLGLEGPRAVHHLTSGRILAADRRLGRWFSAAQLQVMRAAVEDHRASSSRAPRNIYGKIVAEADRDLEPATVVRRAVEFGLAAMPAAGVEAHWQRFRQHMAEKYSRRGYLHLWIAGSPNEAHLQALRALIDDEAALRRAFDEAWTLGSRE